MDNSEHNGSETISKTSNPTAHGVHWLLELSAPIVKQETAVDKTLEEPSNSSFRFPPDPRAPMHCVNYYDNHIEDEPVKQEILEGQIPEIGKHAFTDSINHPQCTERLCPQCLSTTSSTKKRKENSSQRRERDQRYRDKHRQEINQRRRESRMTRKFLQPISTCSNLYTIQQGVKYIQATKDTRKRERDRRYRERHREEINRRRRQSRQLQQKLGTNNTAKTTISVNVQQHGADANNY